MPAKKKTHEQYRLAVFSDFHAGNIYGLATPDHHMTELNDVGKMQLEFWNWFDSSLKAWADIETPDAIFILGDCIDGPPRKCAESTEYIYTDRDQQCDIAEAIIERIIQVTKCNEVYMVYGTPSHTGQGGRNEKKIAENIGAVDCAKQLFVPVGDDTVHLFHDGGKGRGTPGSYGTNKTKKNAVKIRLHSVLGDCPDANIFMTAHEHTFFCEQDAFGAIMGNPCLQLMGSIYADKIGMGPYCVGFTMPDICDGHLNSNLVKARTLQSQVLKRSTPVGMRKKGKRVSRKPRR